MLTNGTTYQTANRLDRFVGFELLVRLHFYRLEAFLFERFIFVNFSFSESVNEAIETPFSFA